MSRMTGTKIFRVASKVTKKSVRIVAENVGIPKEVKEWARKAVLKNKRALA